MTRRTLDWVCRGCGCSVEQEYYMLHDSVWQQVYQRRSGMLCVGCVESRLGRELTCHDFVPCGLNEFVVLGIWPGSDRLRTRLAGYQATGEHKHAAGVLVARLSAAVTPPPEGSL